MHHGVDAECLAQPDVKREIVVRRDEIRVVIGRLGIDVVAARGLNADNRIAEARHGEAERPLLHMRIVLRLPQRAVTASRTARGSRAKAAT